MRIQIATGSVCLILLVCLAQCAGQALAKSPDIVVFLSDDHGHLDSSPYGATNVRTPNMQRLANAGIVFDHAYVASPACAPSRAALLTGLMPARNGAEANHSYKRDDVASLPATLQQLGYETAAFGKVAHGKNDVQRHGFDFHDKRHDVGFVRKFLESRDSSKPLCLFVGTHEPHVPWPDNDGYEPSVVQLPETFIDTEATRDFRTRYYTDVTKADTKLGEVMDLVEQRLDPENTLLIYSSDHGAQWPYAKWNLYDAGIRAPMIARWPGHITPATRTDAMVQWTDLLPTLIEVAGGEPAGKIDGESFLPVLLDERDQHRSEVFTTHSGDGGMNVYPIRSIRTQRWKLIWNLHPEFAHTTHIDKALAKDGGRYWLSWYRRAATDSEAAAKVNRYHRRPEFELYDMQNDPLEQSNLAAEASHQALVGDLLDRLRDWIAEQGDQKTVFNQPRLLSEPASTKPGKFSGQDSRPDETSAALFADPNYHGSCDPEVVWNPHTKSWFVYYTARRAKRDSASYVGTPIGVIESKDMKTWEFRGYCGFDGRKGRPDNGDTHWAPGVIVAGDTLHMFATYKDNANPPWGGAGVIRHYTTSLSSPINGWKLQGVPNFRQPDPIDVSILKVGKRFHAYYRVAKDGGIQWAVSDDLQRWENQGKCPGDINAADRGFGYQEAPHVFKFKGQFWMLTDPHDGLAVFCSRDAITWKQRPRILREPGQSPSDATRARHPSVIVTGERAFIFYHTEPNRPYPTPPAEKRTPHQKISFLQMRELTVENGNLVCDRNVVRAASLLDSSKNVAGWQPALRWGDQGDGTYHNPVLNGDFADSDVERDGDRWLMITSTNHLVPGMTILESKDLVNWRYLSHVWPRLSWDARYNADKMNGYKWGVWAGDLVKRDGEWLCYQVDNQSGLYMSKATKPEGPWSEPVCLLKKSKWTDPAVYFDEETEQAWLVANFGKLADRKTHDIRLFRMNWAGDKLLDEGQTIYQGELAEAAKIRRFDGRWHMMMIQWYGEGEDRDRKQLCLRSTTDSIYGPYEKKIVFEQSSSEDRSACQGSLVQTDDGKWWFLHQLVQNGTPVFQGRPQCLQPVTWVDGWPIIGQDIDGDGIGEPVWNWEKPRSAGSLPASKNKDVAGWQPALQTSDEFESTMLGPQWNWNHNPRSDRWSLSMRPGWLRLIAGKPIAKANGTPGDFWQAANTLSQRHLGVGRTTATVRIDVQDMMAGGRAGLCHFSGKYAAFGVRQDEGNRRHLFFNNNGNESAGPTIDSPVIYLRSQTEKDHVTFEWSVDGDRWQSTQWTYTLVFGRWRGN